MAQVNWAENLVFLSFRFVQFRWDRCSRFQKFFRENLKKSLDRLLRYILVVFTASPGRRRFRFVGVSGSWSVMAAAAHLRCMGVGHPRRRLRRDSSGQAEALDFAVRLDGLWQWERQQQVLLLLLLIRRGRDTLTVQLGYARHTILVVVLALHRLLMGGEVAQIGAIEGHVDGRGRELGYLESAQRGVICLVEGVLGRSYVGAGASRGRLEGGGVRVGREVALGGGGKGLVLGGPGLPVLGKEGASY